MQKIYIATGCQYPNTIELTDLGAFLRARKNRAFRGPSRKGQRLLHFLPGPGIS